MGSVESGDELYVRINSISRVADGLCMGGWNNISNIHIDDAPDIPIHVHGDVEPGHWYLVTISDIQSSHIMGKAQREIEGRGGEIISDKSGSEQKVWWVDTQGAECYHSNQNCQMIRRREGNLLEMKVDIRNSPLPEPISNLRRCHHCF